MEVVLKDICFGYNKKYLFKDLNITFRSNIITGIIGHNNSGKTTLLNIISGYIKPNKGEIITNNSISYISQNSILDYNKTVYELLDVNNKLFNISDILKVLNLEENILNNKLNTLSDSEFKKVIIGLTLIQNNELILLDCPNNLLDYKSCLLLVKFLRNLKIKYGKTILLTSNDTNFIHMVCDDVLLLNNKPIIGDKYNIFTNDELIKKSKLEIPKVIDISKFIYDKKNIKIGYRDDINDLIKDIYRYAK